MYCDVGAKSLRRFCKESDLFHSSGFALGDACILGACKGRGLVKWSGVDIPETVLFVRCLRPVRGLRLSLPSTVVSACTDACAAGWFLLRGVTARVVVVLLRG